jgi:hypothetical protein
MEKDTTDSRKRSQEAYDAARQELAALGASRPLAEIQAVVDAAKPRCRIFIQRGKEQTIYASLWS